MSRSKMLPAINTKLADDSVSDLLYKMLLEQKETNKLLRDMMFQN
jgi:hypothetical protein